MFAFYTFSVLFLSDVGYAASRTSQTSKALGVTTYGDWGSFVTCNPGEYFHGFRVKIEADWNKIEYEAYNKVTTDQTALNAVELLCESETPEKRARDKRKRSSKEGEFGDWSQWYFCPKDWVIGGVKVFSEANQGPCWGNGCGNKGKGGRAKVKTRYRRSYKSGYSETIKIEQRGKYKNDDTAANNVHFQCRPKFGAGEVYWIWHDARENKAESIEWKDKSQNEPEQDMFADWSLNDRLYLYEDGHGQQPNEFTCEKGSHMYSFRARVEDNQGGREGDTDDTALNQLQFKCEKLPDCEHVELTNIQEHMCFKKDDKDLDKDGKPKIILDKEGKPIRYKCEDGPQLNLADPIVDPGVFLGTVDNCDHAMPQKQKLQMTKSRTIDVWERYSMEKSANDAFTKDITNTHDFSVQVGYAFEITKVYKGKGWAQVDNKMGRTDSYESSMKSSDKTTEGKREIELRGYGNEYDVTVPGYRKYEIRAMSVGYRGTTKWTADAICWDKAKKNKLKVVPMDGKYESVGYAKEEMVIKDVSSQCKPQCKCEAVYSKQLYGAKCTAATGETSDRNKGDLVNGERFWCYVRKGACSKDYSGQLDTKTDKGLVNKNAPIPSDFEWSSYPCRNKQLVDAQGIHEKKKSRRLDTINPELMRPTTDGTGYAPGPVVSTESEIPTDPEIEEQEESTVRRLANPTPSPTTWLEAPGIPEFWPLYAMEECTCDQPGEENTITCHWHTWTCPSLKPTCFSWDIVWGDDWETLCK